MNSKPRFRALMYAALVCLTLTPALYSKEQPRDWKDGVLLDSNTERGKRLVPTQYGSVGARDDITYYNIDDGKMIYVVARTLKSHRDKALDVTINGHVQFAIDGGTCYLRDAEGKEHNYRLKRRSQNRQSSPFKVGAGLNVERQVAHSSILHSSALCNDGGVPRSSRFYRDERVF